MKKVMILIVTVFVTMTTAAQDAKQLQLTQEWDKTFPKSEKVNHKKVVFHNRYNITLVGDLYTPKNAQGKLPAIAFCGPYGAVKEQSSGKYAQRIAEAGFITLAFDPSFNGESGGEPRHLTSPEIFTEDFSAAVDFLSVQDFVDADHIGIMGICAFGSFALNAAQIDTRIKATATSTMWRLDGILMGDRKQQLDAWNAQRMRTIATAPTPFSLLCPTSRSLDGIVMTAYGDSTEPKSAAIIPAASTPWADRPLPATCRL